MVLNKNTRLVLWAVLFLFFISCKKEKAVDKLVESMQLPTSSNVTHIQIIDSSTFYCSSGLRFGQGQLFQSLDAGVNWTSLLTHPQEINDFDILDSKIRVYPWGNKLLTSNDTGQNFSISNLPGWAYYAAGTTTPNYSYMVAGENFSNGIVVKYDDQNNLANVDSIPHELTDIHCWNDSSCIATGYGVILRTINGGIDWVPDQARGDFYKAIDFGDAETAYVVGDYGSIWKTTTMGADWKKIRSGSTFINNNNRFIDVFFRNAEEGVIVGKKGLCWLTYNGGESWVPIKNLGEDDFFTVLIANNRVYVGAENGMIYHFEFE